MFKSNFTQLLESYCVNQRAHIYTAIQGEELSSLSSSNEISLYTIFFLVLENRLSKYKSNNNSTSNETRGIHLLKSVLTTYTNMSFQLVQLTTSILA